MSYYIYLIECKKRSFIKSFSNYEDAASYCKQGKLDCPSVWFLIQAESAQGFKINLFLKQSTF